MFSNRQHAARLLSNLVYDHLAGRKGPPTETTVVVGLPRGGVPVALEIALALRCPLDVIVSKKMGAPDNRELAIGAVSSDGVVVIDEHIGKWFGLKERFEQSQEEQRKHLVAETRAMEDYWVRAAGMQARPCLSGKTVVIADDGIATGMTTMAALRTVKGRGAAETILATPVVPFDTFNRLQSECDKLIAIAVPYDFSAVGFYYEDFHQVTDEEVITALKAARERNLLVG